MDRTATDAPGLHLHRASRIEALAEGLAQRLAADPPPALLAPQRVIAAHPGLERWLQQQLARRPLPDGGPGIAANLEVLLPGEWLEATLAAVLGPAPEAAAAWQRGPLRWRLQAVLAAIDEPALRAVLGDPAAMDAGRRRFALADRLAARYAQYLVYRPDWIARWERGRARDEDGWQARLWSVLVRDVGLPHRAARVAEALAALADPATAARLPEQPVHVFGVAHLPPDVLALLRAVARWRRVHVDFPDPCREHWVFLRDRRALLREGPQAERAYFEIGHPLLASLGRLGQQFALALLDDDALVVDDRDPADELDDDPGPALLARLQASLRRLDPDLVGAPVRDAPDRAVALRECRRDASLRVHRCHTRLRELEVLRDALLAALAEDATLAPHEIVVMAPDVAAYAPLLPVVFGEPGRARAEPGELPWHLVDVGLSRTHPLLAAFRELLQLAERRLTRSEVLALLDLPPVARALGLDPAGRARLDVALARAGVIWGLDADARGALGAAAIAEHTWAWGLDRLYAGVLLGEGAPSDALPGIAPVGGIAGAEADALGALDALLDRLRALRQAAGATRTPDAWARWTQAWVEDLFAIDGGDAEERAALEALRRAIAAPALEARAAGIAPALDYPAWRWLLEERLDAVPERQSYLAGGITVCGMVPQRTVPYRVVAVLGLNDGEYPRGAADAGLDLMREAPRFGDRDTRSDDRYLFLEALMAARNRLHLSWIGEDVRDGKPRRPAQPLAELLAFLDNVHALDADDPQPDRPWRLDHPLQPWDARYFAGAASRDPRWFSFHAGFAPAPEPAPPARATRWLTMPPDAATAPAVPDEASTTPSLDELQRFWRDPARDWCRTVLGMRLDAPDDELAPESEALDVAPEARDDPLVDWLLAALSRGVTDWPEEPPPALRAAAALPVGEAGRVRWREARGNLQAALAAWSATPPGSAGWRPQALPVQVTLDDGLRLQGRLGSLFADAQDRLWLVDFRVRKAPGFAYRVPLWLAWATLVASVPGSRLGGVLAWTRGGRDGPALDPALAGWTREPAAARQGLREFAGWWLAARHAPLPWFPGCADARLRYGDDPERLRAAWEGTDDWPGERDREPGYLAVLAEDDEPWDQPAVVATFEALFQRIRDRVDPPSVPPASSRAANPVDATSAPRRGGPRRSGAQ